MLAVMSSTIPDAAVQSALKSEYTPLTLDTPMRRARFNRNIGGVLVLSGVILVACFVVAAMTGGGGGAVAILATGAVFGLVLCVLGFVLGRSSLMITSDGHVVVRGLRTQTLPTPEVVRFEVGILPWSGSHRGPAPMVVLRGGRKLPVRALNHSPLSFPSQFDSDIVGAICTALNELIERAHV